jgi:hypothetical protein
VAQQPEQHIEHDHRAGIADMGKVVNRGAADIHPHILGIERREDVFGFGQGVEEAQGHRDGSEKGENGSGKRKQAELYYFRATREGR